MSVGFSAGPVPATNPSGKKRALGVLGALWLLLLGCGAEVERGAGIYVERCLTCHGTEGAGNGSRASFLPGGVANLRRSSLSEEELRRVISEGRRLMPAFGPALKEEEIRGVVAFVRRFQRR
ncbi:MAG: cytochrome c [bacterium]